MLLKATSSGAQLMLCPARASCPGALIAAVFFSPQRHGLPHIHRPAWRVHFLWVFSKQGLLLQLLQCRRKCLRLGLVLSLLLVLLQPPNQEMSCNDTQSETGGSTTE